MFVMKLFGLSLTFITYLLLLVNLYSLILAFLELYYSLFVFGILSNSGGKIQSNLGKV